MFRFLLLQNMVSMLGLQYIKDMKTASGGYCDRAAIIGKNGSIWASTLNFQDSELQVIATAFRTQNFDTFQNYGIIVEGVKYQLLR